MQVSVPGMKKKPAPYKEQILTYSTALALTGRSAACAPPTATRTAAEPRVTLLIIFMFTSELLCWEGSKIRQATSPEADCLALNRFTASHAPCMNCHRRNGWNTQRRRHSAYRTGICKLYNALIYLNACGVCLSCNREWPLLLRTIN